MPLDTFLESLQVEALGIEKYGFIDGIETETNYGYSSCSSTNNESTSLLSDTTTETHSTSDSLCPSSDFSVEHVTIPTVATNTGYGTDNYATQTIGIASKLSNPTNAGNEHLHGTCAHQDKIVDGNSNLIDNPNSNISIIGYVCKATKEDTCQISYPHLGLFNGGKNIWCNCIEYSRSSWDDAYDLRDNWESLANYYPPGETDEGTDDSILNNCTSKTAEDYDIGTLDYYFDSDNEDYQYESSSQIYGPASPKGNMPVYGSLGDEGSCSRAKSMSGLVNNQYDYSSLLGDYMHLMYNRFDPKMSDMLAMTPDKLLYLMTDPNEWSTFKELIPFYTESQLKLIVRKISDNNEKLIKTACNEIGSRSLQGLIKKLKKLNLAMPITQALSSGCYLLMIHNFGRGVIQQCFTYLDANENKPLYEEVIHHCVELSTHKIGCLSINACIDTIIGSQRDILLDAISDHTLYLSFQSYGTFVIQHVLQLRHPNFGEKICELLIGNYARLSQVYRGSHLVEKCLQFSNLGLVYFMDEIQTRQGMLQILATHEFGNYVIQQAVTISKRTNTSYYGYLIKNLLPVLPFLENIKYGKKLANLLRDLIQERM